MVFAQAEVHLPVRWFSGGSRGGARGTLGPPLFLDQTETRRAEKKFVSETGPPPTYLRVWMIPPTTCYSVNISLIKGVF